MALSSRLHSGRKMLLVVSALCATAMAGYGAMSFAGTTASSAPTYDITTLAGKVASVNGTAGLQIRFSAFIEQESSIDAPNPIPNTTITPNIVLSSPLDGTSVVAPAVTVNQDTAAAPQNETAIVVDPNNSNRLVAAANDYVTRTWTCDVNGTPCSALGDGYSGTYYSNDGGKTWHGGPSTNPSHIGTLIPGVEHLTGGPYDAGGDPAVAFDSRGHVYYAGLGFDRTSAPNTVAVNKGAFNGSGTLTWGPPTFINQTTAPSTFNDKEWIAADWHASSPFRDRVYVSWTRFIFSAQTGAYVQSPIFLAFSTDGGQTFSTPQNIGGAVHYDQGSRPVVGYDGTVYVFWDGSTRLASLDSTYMVKSTDGGVTWSKPVAVAQLVDITTPANAAFRVNSFPAADVAPNGDLYVAWSTQVDDTTGGLCAGGPTNTGCHVAAVYSKSIDGGSHWSAPALIFSALDASTQTAIGYPATNPDGSTLDKPTARRVDTFWPGVAVSPSGKVFMSAYAADVVSPWQICASGPPPPVGRITCDTLGNYIDNARLDYYVANFSASTVKKVSTHPINTQYGFGGGFIGDYTDLAVGADNKYHAFWTDTNNVQLVDWFYGFEFSPTPSIHQQDVVTASGP
jgi:BNR/Asp-box repeat